MCFITNTSYKENMKSSKEVQDFFEDTFYNTYWSDEFTEEISEQEANSIIKLIGSNDVKVLDWRGGWGRHSIYFAKSGMRVVILDFVKKNLDIAKSRFKEYGLEVETIQEDCRNTPSSIQADVAVCLTNAFGYMEYDQELESFKSLYDAIKPGGKLILDCMNLLAFKDTSLSKTETEEICEDGYIKRQYNEFDYKTNILYNKFELQSPDGKIQKREFNQMHFTPCDLNRLLSHAGFTVTNIYGDFNCSEFNFSSDKIIIIAEK